MTTGLTIPKMAGPSAMLHLLTLLLFIAISDAHSWVDQLALIGTNGTFTGAYGYPRGYMQRQGTFDGHSNMYLLPPLSSGRQRVDNTDLLCHPAQRTQNQTAGLPRLQVAPGSALALKYLENGHVTLLNVPGKPYPGSGTVLIFGTTEPSSTELLTDVMKWNQAGTGGDKRGRLLASNNFDDGRCYQINPTCPRAVNRASAYPNHPIGQPTASSEELACEANVVLPTDPKIVPPGKTMTLYWVWEWPTLAGTPGEPYGKDEYYTTCIDLDVVNGPIPESPVSNTMVQQDPNIQAVSNYKSRTATTSEPVLYNQVGSATYGSAPPGSTNGQSCPAEGAPATAMAAFPGASFPSGAPPPAATPAPASQPAAAPAAQTAAAPAEPAPAPAQAAPAGPASSASPQGPQNMVVDPDGQVRPSPAAPTGDAKEIMVTTVIQTTVSTFTITGVQPGASVSVHKGGLLVHDIATTTAMPAPAHSEAPAVPSAPVSNVAPLPKASATYSPPPSQPPPTHSYTTVYETEPPTTTTVTLTVAPSANLAPQHLAPQHLAPQPPAQPDTTTTHTTTTRKTTITTTIPKHLQTLTTIHSNTNATVEASAETHAPDLQNAKPPVQTFNNISMDPDCTHTAAHVMSTVQKRSVEERNTKELGNVEEAASTPAVAQPSRVRRHAAPYARRHARDLGGPAA